MFQCVQRLDTMIFRLPFMVGKLSTAFSLLQPRESQIVNSLVEWERLNQGAGSLLLKLYYQKKCVSSEYYLYVPKINKMHFPITGYLPSLCPRKFLLA